MTACPALGEIEVKWRASGTGVCIIVEGETELDDVWFYKQWFDNHAREVTFFPQDGWEQVVSAVANLRVRLGAKRVYGIIDRDFEANVVYDPFPRDGILCTPKYTLENYLLNAECWFKRIHPYTRRTSKPGWNTPEEALATLKSLYRECLPLSAYNWTLRQARHRDYTAFKALRDEDKEYKEHPKAIKSSGDIQTRLRKIQTQMGISDDLAQMYVERVRVLQEMPLVDLEQVVSGKYVLKLLRERFPLRIASEQAWDDVLGAYMDTCPDPPTDLVTMLDLILQDAHP